jgi:hypothetical protein
VITADSQPIDTMADLMAVARGHWPGDSVDVEVSRYRTDWMVSVELGAMPRGSATPAAPVTPTTSRDS